jgi:diacylglycerol kinase
MTNKPQPDKRHSSGKFANALRGLKFGVRSQSSFFVHFFVAAVVIAAGWAVEVGHGDWCLLLVCVTVVMAAEMFNSALEHMAAAIHPAYNKTLGEALDIAAAAVLIASVGASAVGVIVFFPYVWKMFAAGS